MRFHLLAKYALLALTTICLLSGCKEESGKEQAAEIPPLTDSIVKQTYSLFVDGHYRDYALQMQTTEGKPEEYVKDMEILYKQHAAELSDNYDGIKSFKVNRIRTKEGDASAAAFLEVTYGDGSEEEIMLPFINVGGKWKLR